MSVEIYVYYKVLDANLDAALRAFEQALLGLSGPCPRLLRREGSTTGEQTWMEIHAGANAQADEQRLAVAMSPYLSGIRHSERFSPLR
ncbi:DUF4936 family protein [Paucibacter sp. TC2R-5]|uniref:DUF4936 family protein n=1 Tax=Paucibacter sp. TC2R-5 TaxID=2893555 RepID=UPI0021E3A67E|nr:DUF4936 family protein [Paucibacter sp. TC2R-5]MCV2360921.1 DUF4936 family protein [Paucibacter sp. TC2R-5]